MNEDTRSVVERTTRSEHFDWTEWTGGGHWSGKRNAQTVFEIIKIDGGMYILECPALQRIRPRRCGSLEETKRRADKEFADWAHSLGLKIGEEWWKRGDES